MKLKVKNQEMFMVMDDGSVLGQPFELGNEIVEEIVDGSDRSIKITMYGESFRTRRSRLLKEWVERAGRLTMHVVTSGLTTENRTHTNDPQINATIYVDGIEHSFHENRPSNGPETHDQYVIKCIEVLENALSWLTLQEERVRVFTRKQIAFFEEPK